MRYDHLDMIRGLAAILVLTGHIRAFVFKSYSEHLEHGNLFLLKAFYFVTGLGSAAVLTFFAISGFLVGGKVLSDFSERKYVWSSYLLRRLTRLWIVVLPALVLTFFFDQIGIRLLGGIGYDGRYFEILNTGPQPGSGVSHDFKTFLSNIVFLQTITSPVFGSNQPMWSLSNEFWYYILFPLLAWILVARASAKQKYVGFVALIILLVALPLGMLEAGTIWLAGAVAAWSVRRPNHMIFWQHIITRIISLVILSFSIIALKTQTLMGDIGFGLIVAATLPTLALFPSFGSFYQSLARKLSEISYTLYLTHYPLLFLLVLLWITPFRYDFGFDGIIIFFILFSISMVWAGVVWWCFERNTDRLYYYIIERRRSFSC